MNDWRRVRELFDLAVELDDVQRGAFIEAECGDNFVLQRELQSLLRADREAETTAFQLDDAQPVLTVGERYGPYSIVRKIGQGGMGSVWLADQSDPIRRVALKLPRWQSYSRVSLLRFQFEAAALARLNHQAVAQIFHAGKIHVRNKNLSYIAMEFVNGVSITQYSQNNKLNVNAKVRLLVELSRGMEHAHQGGVIHRDLKPSNVLVTRDGQPKVLDFGIARAASASGSVEPSELTLTGELVGTLAYMSPEQVCGEAIDTRTDVYSIGLIACELLSGKLPYDIDSSTSIPEAADRIRNCRPERTLSNTVDADLLTVLLVALAKEPQDRFSSAKEFGDDLQRWLDHQPIEARRQSKARIFRLFVRRNPWLTASVVTAAIALLLGFCISLWQWNRAELRTSAHLQTIKDLTNSWDGLNNKEQKLALYRARAEITAQEVGQMDVGALLALRESLHRRCEEDLGLPDDAERELELGLEVGIERLGESHAKTIRMANLLGDLYMNHGKPGKNIAVAKRLLPHCRSDLPENHEDTLRMLTNLGAGLCGVGDFEGAEAALKEALLGFIAAHRSKGVVPHDDERMVALRLAEVMCRVGRYEEASQVLLAALEAVGVENCDIVSSTVMGNILASQRQWSEALSYYELALEKGRSRDHDIEKLLQIELRTVPVLVALKDENRAMEILSRDSRRSNEELLDQHRQGVRD